MPPDLSRSFIAGSIRPKKTRSTLILSITLVHVLLMSLFVMDTTRRQKNFLKQQSLDQATHLANDLSINSGYYIIGNDVVGLQNLLDDYKNLPHLKYAVITSAEGYVLAHSDR